MAETVLPENTQQFEADEIVDGFGEGTDDGAPMGLGGEKGKQAEPADSTLEADIAKGEQKQTTQPSGDDLPPDEDTVSSESEPVRDTADEGGAEPQPPDEPETPEFPPALLRMVGYATPEEAQQAGFKDPESLLAAAKWRSKLLAPEAPSSDGSDDPYRSKAPKSKAASAQPAPSESQDEPSGFEPFQPANADAFDEDLQGLIKAQNDHFAEQFRKQQQRFDAALKSRDEREVAKQNDEQMRHFDKAIQGLGEDWQDVFGKGDGLALIRAGERDPAAMTAAGHRAMTLSAVKAIREANEKQGFEPMDLEQEIQWALMRRYPDKFKQLLQRTSISKAVSRRGVQASRPTARKIPLASRNERTLAAVDTMLKRKGRPGLDYGQEEEFDGDI